MLVNYGKLIKKNYCTVKPGQGLISYCTMKVSVIRQDYRDWSSDDAAPRYSRQLSVLWLPHNGYNSTFSTLSHTDTPPDKSSLHNGDCSRYTCTHTWLRWILWEHDYHRHFCDNTKDKRQILPKLNESVPVKETSFPRTSFSRSSPYTEC